MNNAVYGKAKKNVRKKIDVKLVSNKKDYLKWTFKQSQTSHKIFDNDLITIRKNKVTLRYIGVFILELSKVLMYEFHYYYRKQIW